MKKTLLTGALAATIAAPVFAQRPSQNDQILNELRALTQRVERLEQDNSRLSAENTDLKSRNDRLEATTDYLRSNTQASRRDIAEGEVQLAKIPDIEKASKAAEWASKITWRGDFRYRHEFIDPEEAVRDQTRQRIRARFGLQAKINDTITTTVQLATNGGNSDPRSTNQTLGDGLSRKGVGIDLAYAEWKPMAGLSVQLGKTPYAWQRVGSYFWDGDITWEGGAVKYEHGPFFANALGSWLQESATANDATLLGAQLGLKGQVGGVKLLGAVNYFDIGSIQNQITTTATSCTPNVAFFGGPQGNTTVTSGGCARLRDDFNMFEGIFQADFTLGKQPLVVFVDYIQNQEAADLDTGYAAGFTFGRASNPRTWEFGYTYQDAEKNAQFGQFYDSDFGGGVTDTRGSVFRIGYVPARGWILNGTYFINERFVDVGTQRDYDRLQLDLNYRF